MRLKWGSTPVSWRCALGSWCDHPMRVFGGGRALRWFFYGRVRCFCRDPLCGWGRNPTWVWFGRESMVVLCASVSAASWKWPLSPRDRSVFDSIGCDSWWDRWRHAEIYCLFYPHWSAPGCRAEYSTQDGTPVVKEVEILSGRNTPSRGCTWGPIYCEPVWWSATGSTPKSDIGRS